MGRFPGDFEGFRGEVQPHQPVGTVHVIGRLACCSSISAAGNTLVMGLPKGFVPLNAGKAAPNGPDAKGNKAGEP